MRLSAATNNGRKPGVVLAPGSVAPATKAGGPSKICGHDDREFERRASRAERYRRSEKYNFREIKNSISRPHVARIFSAESAVSALNLAACGKLFNGDFNFGILLILKRFCQNSFFRLTSESKLQFFRLHFRLALQHGIVHLSKRANDFGEKMTNSAQMTRNQRHRQLMRAQGFRETNLWLPESVLCVIDQAVSRGAYPSRQVAVAKALEAAFLLKERNNVT